MSCLDVAGSEAVPAGELAYGTRGRPVVQDGGVLQQGQQPGGGGARLRPGCQRWVTASGTVLPCAPRPSSEIEIMCLRFWAMCVWAYTSTAHCVWGVTPPRGFVPGSNLGWKCTEPR